MDKDKKELMLKRAEEMSLRGKKIEDTLDLLKKQIDLLQKDKEDYRKDYINAKQEVYKDEVVERLKTIPGVGKITASTLRAYIGDINRFDTYRPSV